MQRTIKVNDKKIKIVTNPRTSMGNLCGYRTKIYCGGVVWTGDYFTLNAQKAMDKAYVKWVKERV